jgi:hypothetical protein
MKNITKEKMDTLAKNALDQAKSLTGTDGTDEHTQKIAFKLACAVAAQMTAESN